MRHFFCAILPFVLVLSLSAQESPEVVWSARVFWADQAELQALAAMVEPVDVRREEGTATVIVDRRQINRLRRAGFRLSLERVVNPVIQPHQKGEGGIVGFPCYPTVDETYALLDQWAAAYPDLVQVIDIGDSWEKQFEGGGDDLRVLKITGRNGVENKAPWFAMGALHAREYTTAALLTRFAEELLTGYGEDPNITWQLDHGVFHFLLIANPDGRRRAEQALFWRKNADNDYCTGSNFRGIDLNRNFTFQWGCCFGSSGVPCDETFRGPEAGSEPEIQALTDYVRMHFPDNRGPDIGDGVAPDAAGVFLDIHSYGRFVLWPFGYSQVDSADNAVLQRLGRKFAFFNGYSPEKASASFVTDGTSDDWAYGELGLAAFTFELGTSFFQPCEDFENTILPDNLAALRYSARVARAPFSMPGGPDVIALNLARTVVLPGDTILITATADDTRFSTRNGAEPSAVVTSVRLTVDTPPWLTDGDTPTFDAADGTFDSAVESVVLSWSPPPLTPGRHTVFVQARDADGDWGPVSAAFISYRAVAADQLTAWPEQVKVTDMVAALNALEE
ncbi:M14 family zinc carboxypeptidase [Acanthopleuribacter pedis]|uniref:carboxypeptidase T n=1 Tax=Acanthopleuribacter pedis TaxID=442870 RepID=A0A8J7QBN2_9BACT|nr:M14 family zinc carboxypeptidase [Acanthopleuribacter pedis]MBO1320734.1 hypothetical protein [Acanthopleuribacter pedis]